MSIALKARLQAQTSPLLCPLADVVVLGACVAVGAVACAAGGGLALAGVSLALAEAAWYVIGKFRLRRAAQPPPYLPDAGRVPEMLERFLTLGDVFGIEEFLSGWFMGTPARSILRGNVREFIIYGFYARTEEELSAEQLAAVDAFLAQVEQRFGVAFRPGYDASLSFMAHLWQPLRVYHKPLVFQLGAELAARSAHLLLLLMGFRPRTAAGGFSCWVAAAVVPAPPAAQRTAAAGNGQAATPFTARRCRIADSAAEDEGADGMHKAATASAACPRSPRLLQRASGAGGVMHQAAEQVLDDVVDIISEVSGAVAAQHPHGQPTSPRPLRAASDPLHSGSFLTQAGDMGPRSGGYASSPARATLRRAKQDSALDYELMDGAAAAMAPGSPPIPAYLPSESPGRSGSGHGNVPVVFLHGVGLGVMPYLHLVRAMQRALPNTQIMVVEVPHVALRPVLSAQRFDDIAAAVQDLVLQSGASTCCVVAHSFGSFVASRIVQLYPQLVHSLCLLDPVTMMTCYPQLLANFIYRTWHLPHSFSDAVDLIRFLCSRDLNISELFHWSELMLWPQDLPCNSLVVLSGADDLVPSELVMAQLKMSGHPAKVLFHRELGHGGFLMDFDFQALIISHLQQMLATAESPLKLRDDNRKTKVP